MSTMRCFVKLMSGNVFRFKTNEKSLVRVKSWMGRVYRGNSEKKVTEFFSYIFYKNSRKEAGNA